LLVQVEGVVVLEAAKGWLLVQVVDLDVELRLAGLPG
jgi:hypothetical protein